MITDDFSAYAVGIDIHLDRPVTAAEVRGRVEELLVAIAKACDQAGATLIGHIKAVVETEGKGFLGISVTEPTGKATTRGELQDGAKALEITVNVLLYGLTRSKVQELVDPLAMRMLDFPGSEIELEDLEEHHHDHGRDDHDGHVHEHDEHDHC